MKSFFYFLMMLAAAVICSCNTGNKKTVPVIGFVDFLQDETLSQARIGFVKALKDSGFSEDKKNIEIKYRNAQGSIPTLTQIVNYFISDHVTLLGTCTTLSTVTALQKTKTIPIFEMVSPTPERMKVLDAKGNAPKNLFGAMEDLPYIDTSFSIIPTLVTSKAGKLVVGMIYSQGEPQSLDAKDRIQSLADKLNITLVALPVNSSADAQLITQSLLSKNIDAFFANPDNSVFASFETILKSCNQKNVPIFTSEAGLVKRGAVAAFGADMYQWGYQAGKQAAQYLKTKSTAGLKPEMVKIRKRVYNAAAAQRYHIAIPSNFEAVK